MRIDHDDEAADQAIAWHQALARDEPDWDGYLTWLDADPVHRRVYDEIALLDRAVIENIVDLRVALADRGMLAANDHGAYVAGGHVMDRDIGFGGSRVGSPRRWWMAGGAMAMALALVLAVPALFARPDTVYTTAPGESRRIALGAGETVDLAPSSRLIARRGDPRTLELAQGEAYFSVVHDPSRKLSIRAEGFAVTDIGTRFGVNLTEGRVTVAVADGQLTVAAIGGESRQLIAGQQLVGHAGKLMPVAPVAAEDVGSWRSGRLVYNHMPLRIVVADLARFSGKRVTVDTTIAGRPFSGVLGISDGSRPFQNLADLMSITYTADADGVRFVAGPAR